MCNACVLTKAKEKNPIASRNMHCAPVKKNKMVWFCNAKAQFMVDITEKTMPDLFLM